MGVDLRLLPCENWQLLDNGRVWGYSHTILTVGGICTDAWSDFEGRVKPHLKPMPAEHYVRSFIGVKNDGEHSYGTIREKDPYGEIFCFVEAQHLLPWLTDHFLYDGHAGHGPYQTAIVAFVNALPPTTKIVLDWH